MDLHNRVALITGGGRGIGRATALALAALGCDVAVLARSTGEIDGVAAEIAQAGRRSLAVAADLADPAAFASAVGTVQEQLGPIAILVNNAAIVEPLGPSSAADPDAWAQAITINLSSVFRLIAATLPGMRQLGWGRIVSISSGVAAGTGMNHANAYSVSKAGLEMLTRNLAAELDGTGITVNAVRPGTVDTAMQEHIRSQPVERVGQEMHDRFTNWHQDGALLAPEQPAQLIATVIAGDTTGEIISIYDPRAQEIMQRGA